MYLQEITKNGFKLSTGIPLTGIDADKRTTWVHIAPQGEWRGHQGGAFNLNEEMFQSVITEMRERITPISCDYEHASLEPTGEPTPASGFVKDLDIRDGELWALIEFTERAANLIKAGEYKFNSPVLFFNHPDRVLGEEKIWKCVLDSIALTNRPFLDGQSPITLSKKVGPTKNTNKGVSKKMSKISVKKLTEELKKTGKDDLSSEKMKQIIDALVAMQAAMAEDEAEAPAEPAEEAEEVAASTPVALTEEVGEAPSEPSKPVMERLMEALGVDMQGLEAALEANLDAVLAALKGEVPAPEGAPMTALSVRVLSENLEAVKRRLAAYEEKDRKAQEVALTSEVDALVKAGKILPSKKTEMIALAKKDPSTFRALSQAFAPAYPAGKHASALTPPETGSEHIDNNDPRIIALNKSLDRMGVKDEKARKAAALKMMSSNNKE